MQVDELASKLNKSTTEIIKIFFDLGEMITINQIIPYDLAEIVCDQMGYTSQLKVKQTLRLDFDVRVSCSKITCLLNICI